MKEKITDNIWLIGIVLCFIAFAIIANHFGISYEQKHREELREQAIRTRAERIVYFEDRRTGICFAYLWEGGDKGGPALAVVPREQVEHLLEK